MRKKTLGITTCALAVGGLVLARPASANLSPPGGGAWDHVWTSYDSNHGATVSVLEHGDVVQLCDSAADGRNAGVIISWYDPDITLGVSFGLRTSGGYQSCVFSDASVHDITEGERVNVSIYLTESTTGQRLTWYINDH